jgi:hypothetical protein
MLGAILLRQGKPDEAEALLKPAVIELQKLTRPRLTLFESQLYLGECWLRQGRFAEAEGMLNTAWSTLVALRNPPPSSWIRSATMLEQLYLTWDKPAEAAAMRLRLQPIKPPGR